MSSMRSRRKNRIKSDINVVPYIDVMLVLLVIFMVTAPLIPPSTIDLPQVGAQQTTQQTPIEIQINAQGQFSVRNRNDPLATLKPIAEQELLPYIRQQQNAAQPIPVVIGADKKIAYEVVMKTLDQLRAGGVQKVGLLAQPQP